MYLLLGGLIALVSFTAGVFSTGFYGFAAGSFVGFLLQSQWTAVIYSIIAALGGLACLNFAWTVSVRFTRYAHQDDFGYYEGQMVEPSPRSKIIPTVGASYDSQDRFGLGFFRG